MLYREDSLIAHCLVDGIARGTASEKGMSEDERGVGDLRPYAWLAVACAEN